MYSYVVKITSFPLQRGSAKSSLAPPNFSSLWTIAEIIIFFFPHCRDWITDKTARAYAPGPLLLL